MPIDGTLVPREGQFERLLGNIGRQFIRRYADADLLDQIEAQVDLPLPLGRAAVVEMDAQPFRFAVLVSTLHHVDQLDHRAKVALARESFVDAVRVAASAGLTRLATPVLQGGWRLTPTDAFAQMLAAAATCSGPEVHVYAIEPFVHDQLVTLARGVGFLH